MIAKMAPVVRIVVPTGSLTPSSAHASRLLARQPGGEALDVSTRRGMEQGFGHSFGDVRVHASPIITAAASLLGADAFTVGSHIFLRGEPGRASRTPSAGLLAHELAHVVQQRAGTTRSGAVSNAHEADADRAAQSFARGQLAELSSLGPAPPLQMLRVTSGEYGKALEWYTENFVVPDAVIRGLQRSSTFMAMAAELDKHYVAFLRPGIPSMWWANWKPDPATGILQAGPFKGRRMLGIGFAVSGGGSQFNPASPSPTARDNSVDWIELLPPELAQHRRADLPPTDQEIGEWVQLIAHESTHAFRRVTGAAGPAPADIASRVARDVKEEKVTRGVEQRVTGEAIAGPRGRSRLPGFRPQFASTERWAIERDPFPSKEQRTYLETFVFDELIARAEGRVKPGDEPLDEQESRIGDLILDDARLDTYLSDPLPTVKDKKLDIYVSPSTEYKLLRFQQLVVDARWKRFEKEHPDQSEPGFDDAKEKLLQEHARLIFRGLLGYTPRPSAAPPKRP